jgi:transposase InsO family protein
MRYDPSSKPESGRDGAQRPARRRFSDRDKLRILEAADRCARPGEMGILLRREGIYSSHVATWRRVPAGTVPSERQVRYEKERLERENARLRLKLEHAEKLRIVSMRAIDATVCLTDGEYAAVFVVVDHCTGECLGVRAALRGTRFEAMKCLREAVRLPKGHYKKGIAAGTEFRDDYGNQIVSLAFQDKLKTRGIKSSPFLVRQPEGKECVESSIRTLKEQLLSLHQLRAVEELRQALRDFAKRFNNRRIIGRVDYRMLAAP